MINNIASAAYSTNIDKNILEIGIETNDAFRGKGYAFVVCRKIIEYCIANNLRPVWVCKFENIPSYYLAQKLAFTVKKTTLLPFISTVNNLNLG